MKISYWIKVCDDEMEIKNKNNPSQIFYLSTFFQNDQCSFWMKFDHCLFLELKQVLFVVAWSKLKLFFAIKHNKIPAFSFNIISKYTQNSNKIVLVKIAFNYEHCIFVNKIMCLF